MYLIHSLIFWVIQFVVSIVFSTKSNAQIVNIGVCPIHTTEGFNATFSGINIICFSFNSNYGNFKPAHQLKRLRHE